MYLIAQTAAPGSTSISWPMVILVLGLATLVVGLVVGVMDARKARLTEEQEGPLWQVVDRYEKLAEGALDAQQRVAADISELRSRTSSIEQILRTVD